ncbi:MAG: 30S ribosomal protein S3 [Anaerorhabdus sp.]
MGQKVSPIGLRVGVIRDWESRWYAEKEYGNLLIEDVKIREFLTKELHDAYVSRIEIERTSNEVKIILRAARPGVLVGKTEKGEDKLVSLKKKLAKLTSGKEVKIDVIEVANPDLDAYLVARKIAEQLENRQSFRITQKKAIQQTMRSGAKGIKTLVSGRLGGADIARGEGYSEGVVPLHTLRSDIDYAWVEADTTFGKLGVKVWVCRGEVLPGQMVKEPEAAKMPTRDRRPRNNDRRPNAAKKPEAKASDDSKGGN